MTHLLGQGGRLVAAQLQKVPEFLECEGDQRDGVYLLLLLTLSQIHNELCLCGTKESWRSGQRNSYYSASSEGETVKAERMCCVHLTGKSK